MSFFDGIDNQSLAFNYDTEIIVCYIAELDQLIIGTLDFCKFRARRVMKYMKIKNIHLAYLGKYL